MGPDCIRLDHAFAPTVRRRARRLGAVSALLGLVLLLAMPEQWALAAVVAIAVTGLAVAATRGSAVAVTVEDDRVVWCERGPFPGLSHTVRIPRDGVDRMYVGRCAPTLADRVTPVPATVRAAFPRNPEYAEQVLPQRFQLWVIRGGAAVPVVEHPDGALLRAVEQAARQRWTVAGARGGAA